ncbi:hypothetical protein N483_14915 [Pseudoalteromonas luteoviolacea NCIMB 1944]|uniref:Uncharacterized protein n=1 Tax=Pseudoalteromonas luteoviolacea (strain 2ta16) TaxID=1353533 RepID=V4J543_PSEL2|nr:hypothetical protein PL2TA16_01575 [Pseudoalteromonas luteoviolacea 2ta16]KZN41960.1 hypothetical protein N483_14915 [Pseudoalteromonas luteoviolacea NCIMB 1944]
MLKRCLFFSPIFVLAVALLLDLFCFYSPEDANRDSMELHSMVILEAIQHFHIQEGRKPDSIAEIEERLAMRPPRCLLTGQPYDIKLLDNFLLLKCERQSLKVAID